MPVRAYAAADSDALKALERRVTQGGLCVQSYTRFLGDYDCRVRQYAQGFVLVFEDEQGGALLGVVSVALKDVRWPAERRMLRLGWLFDLRVDPTARRRHIASQLTAAAEGRARELGAELMLLSVNGNNRPAKALYQRTGYALVSVRKPAVFHMLRERAVPPRVGDAKVVVESVTSPRAAAQILDAALRDVALAVEPMAGVCENPGFVCTVRATLADGGGGARSGGKDGGAEREADAVSEGGVSLWISPLSQFDVAKVMGLPVRVWMVLGPLLLLALAAALAFGVAERFLAGDDGAAMRLLLPVCAAVALLLLVRRLFFPPEARAFLVRFWAPYARGVHGGALFDAALAAAVNRARALGGRAGICNLAQGDPVRARFGRSLFTTLFMAKDIRARPAADAAAAAAAAAAANALPSLVHALPPDAFFDPRDL